MPGRDRTGPMGTSVDGSGLGLGSGYRRGPGRNFTKGLTVPKTKKELLQEQKDQLQRKLDNITKQLDSYN